MSYRRGRLVPAPGLGFAVPAAAVPVVAQGITSLFGRTNPKEVNLANFWNRFIAGRVGGQTITPEQAKVSIEQKVSPLRVAIAPPPPAAAAGPATALASMAATEWLLPAMMLALGALLLGRRR